MGVTDTHQHCDYTEAARHAVADELDRLARDWEFRAHRHTEQAAHHLEQFQAERDAGLFKAAKATEARRAAVQLRQPAPTLPIEVRAHLLERLAQETNARTLDDDIVTVFLATNAPAVDANQRQSLFDDLCEAVKLRDGLDSKTIDYRTATDVTGMNAEERALDLAHERVFTAVDALIHPVTHAHERNGSAA
ncbi:MAG: hypothetical protein J2P24_08280 [Streptosporangiales bacterium]|nr:hypothetical protein [Streptosporangiales bacterium]